MTAAGAGNNARVGIYDGACSTLLAQSGVVNLVANANKFTLTSPLLASGGGVYHLMTTADNASVQFKSSSTFGDLNKLLNYDAANLRYFSGSPGSSGGSALTLPATCGTRTAITSADPEVAVLFP